MSEKKINNNMMNRRKFIQSTTAAGAGMLFAGKSFGIIHGSKMDDLNVAILGTGAEGQVLMNACLKIPGIRFKAVCDIWTKYNQRRASRILKAYGHEHNTYVDYREMLDKEKDRLDAIIIATPDFWHAEHTIASLNAGLHVYCEKEMSNTLEGAKRMVLAAKKTGKLLQIGHQRRSNPRYIYSYQTIIEELKLLGRITTVHGQWNRSARPDLGWPPKAAIDQRTLEKYGFKSMHQFRNWRWYRGLGGGPVVDLGSHQIDIFGWFLDANPSTVEASGGTDYYDKKTHEWYDNVLSIFVYNTKYGVVRAFYQVITTNSNQGYYETFMGDQGTLLISEAGSRGGVYKEPLAPDWDKWVKKGYIEAPVEENKPKKAEVVLDVRETLAPPSYGLPVKLTDPYHKPHLENFFDAIKGKAELNCPAEIGYETAVTVLKVNQAVEAGRRLAFRENEFHV